MSQFNKSITKRLGELERRRSWLVEKSGVARGHIYDGIKNNTNWSLSTAIRIAEALGLTVDEMNKGEWSCEPDKN